MIPQGCLYGVRRSGCSSRGSWSPSGMLFARLRGLGMGLAPPEALDIVFFVKGMLARTSPNRGLPLANGAMSARVGGGGGGEAMIPRLVTRTKRSWRIGAKLRGPQQGIVFVLVWSIGHTAVVEHQPSKFILRVTQIA